MKNHCANRSFLLRALALLALAAAPAAPASDLGLVDPFGSPALTGLGSSYWDSFPSLAFTADAPDTADSDVFTGTLASTSAGLPPAGVYGSGTRIYIHEGSFGFTANLTAVTDIQAVSLQLKFTTPDVAYTVADYFTASASFGGPPAYAHHGTVTEGANTFNIVTYTWTGLSLPASSAFTVSAAAGTNGFATLDGLRVDAAAVPEPSAFAALAGLATLALATSRRRARA